MFTVMKDRLQRFLELEQLTPSRFADILGIQRSGLSHILSGRNKPGFDFIQKLIVKFPSVNADWLLTGKGKVYKESSESRFFGNEAEIVNNPYPENTTETTPNQQVKPVLIHPEPSENSINAFNQAIHADKKNLKKIIMIYSDGTFTEYTPGEE
ncbi:MAG: transcriptional regulator [Bacteroidetes bacterium HGW-Bacteroidetes-6]|jgi:transcriptional regulator with XRE-family HTH domain|nr:MAG: transcriptional regulator [Bacteroidetes bacterium HGW-Bacteroidetes-6]